MLFTAKREAEERIGVRAARAALILVRQGAVQVEPATGSWFLAALELLDPAARAPAWGEEPIAAE